MRKKPYLIAEACCNHTGSIDIAIKMIREAAKCNLKVIKFQKRNPIECLTNEQYYAPHPCPSNSFGNTYGEHREFLEFTIEEHKILQQECIKQGISYSSSVWDLTSAKEIALLNPVYIKIPSACNDNLEMLDWLCKNYSGDLHISLGMTTRDEEKIIFKIVKENHKEKNLVLYSCTSGYPVPNEDVCLLEIERLTKEYKPYIKGIGFSGHQLSKSIDIAAYMLGADYIERHFTLDRTLKGTDQAASLISDDFIWLDMAFSDIAAALKYKENELLPIELPQRRKMKGIIYES